MPPEYRKASLCGSPTTMSAPSCERMTSSTAWRSSVPGATLAMAASRSGLRRGSSSTGIRVKPRTPRGGGSDWSLVSFVGSFCIGVQPGSDRGPECLRGLDPNLAMRRSSGRGDDGREPELRALLQPPLGLRRRAEAARETDLAEGREALLHGHAPRRGGDRE